MNGDQKGIRAWLRVLNEMQNELEKQDTGCCSSLNSKKDTYQQILDKYNYLAENDFE